MTEQQAGIKLTPIPLSAEAFAPFGDVIEVRESVQHYLINEGNTLRYHDLAQLDVAAEDGRAIVSIFRSTPLAQPISIKLMERHPLGSQLFMPLCETPYLVVVAPKGEFDASKLSVFIANGEQGVNYHAGTWHHYCLALEHLSDFLVIDRAGPGNNCDQLQLDEQILINPDY